MPTSSSICGVNTEPARVKRANLWGIYNVIVISDLGTSSMIKGTQMGCKLGWLIVFVKHAIWVDFLYLLYLLLLSVSKILASFQMTL
jgi:hypothetical protein